MKKWHRVLIVGGLISVMALVSATAHGLWLYANAGYCQSSATNSQVCVAQSQSTVVRQISRDLSDFGEAPDILHGVVLDYKSGTCELWLRDMPSNLTPQAGVSLLRWNGRCIGIVKEGGSKQYSHYWEPGTMIFFIAWILGTFVLFTPLAQQSRRHLATTIAGRLYALCLIIAVFWSAMCVILLVDANTDMGFLM